MLAELLSLSVETEPAIELSGRLLRHRDLSAQQRCRVRGVLGQCYFRKGDYNRGTDHYHIGIETAEHSNASIEECKLRVQLLVNQIRWLGPQHAVANLALLRQKLHHVADPSIAVTFHLALAELAAKLSLTPRARKHLETARALLPTITDQSIRNIFKQSEIALAAEEGDFGEALRCALQMADEGDSRAPKLSLPTLVGHLLIAQSKFAEAEKWLHAQLDEHKLAVGSEIALRDTMMLLRLSQGDLDEAASESEYIQQLLDDTETNDSFFGLWYQLTRVKWLYRCQRDQEGLGIAMGAIPRIERMADRNLSDRMKLLVAEGFGLTGDPLRGTALVAEVFKANPDLPLEITADAFRVTGTLIAAHDPEAALVQFDRAERILRALGNIAAADEIAREAADTVTNKSNFGNIHSGGAQRVYEQSASAQLTERIAALMDTCLNAALLASETLSLVADTDTVLQAKVVRTHPDGRREATVSYCASETLAVDDASGTVIIPLGTHRNCAYEIIAIARPLPTARTTLLAVERLVHRALAHAQTRQLEREQAALWPEQSPEQELGLICSSDRMQALVKTIRRVAGSNITVLFTGETGVGKELFARALHQASARKERTFLPFNCTTVPREMLDSQLFGHRRGSFTGAHEDSAGLIRAAAGGTLFLDEIGDMSLEAQPKLLRFLESGEIRPLGESQPELVDVRIVAATNANLDQLMTEGKFREDLYYRLNVIRIHIPPLRERREEIPLLLEHFLERYSRELQKPMPRVADETLEYLVLYRWPGNVRQLGNEIRRMVAMAEAGAVLMPAHLSAEIAASRRTFPTDRQRPEPTEVVTRIDQPLAAAVEHVERAAIQRALAICDGRVEDAAKVLGLSRKGLYLKRQRLRLE